MELDKELGPVLTVQDMAKLLNLSENTIRTHHKRWGGIEVTRGKYRFFENVVRDKIYAYIGDTKKNEILEGSCDGPGDAQGKALSGTHTGDQEEGDSLGRRDKGKVKVGGDPKRHGLV